MVYMVGYLGSQPKVLGIFQDTNKYAAAEAAEKGYSPVIFMGRRKLDDTARSTNLFAK